MWHWATDIRQRCILTKLLRFDEVIRVISTKGLIPNSSIFYLLLKTIFFSSVVRVQKLCSQVAQASLELTILPPLCLKSAGITDGVQYQLNIPHLFCLRTVINTNRQIKRMRRISFHLNCYVSILSLLELKITKCLRTKIRLT